MVRTCLVIVACFFLASCHSPQAVSANNEKRQLPAANTGENLPILSYSPVVDHVAPAVVTIRASHRVRAPRQFPFSDTPLFREFFGGGSPVPRDRPEVESALGSGVIVRSDGHILTNHHVIDGAEDIKVDLSTRRTYSAKVVGSDSPSDIAVLKISGGDLPVLQLGDSDRVRVGDVCLAVGNPLAVGESVTAGIISAKGRSTDSVGGGSFQDFLQTDAPINQGNSGGALVNTRGELIGINSQILSSNGGNVGIGFAIPSNMAKSVMDQLIGKGSVQRGMLGVSIQPVTSDIASSLGLKDVRGILINSVTPAGPAEKAGLQRGDVILQVDGKDVNEPNQLRNEIAARAPGAEINLTIQRDGKQQQVRTKLGTLTPQTAAADAPGGGSGGGGKLGIGVVPLTPDLAAQLGLRRGAQGLAVQSIDPEGPAAQAGLREGDVIQEVNRQPVHTIDELRSALQKSGDRAPLLLINREGQSAYVPVPLK
uniref:Protease Do n=1 Tax=Solibacter usitatus (strain Ellin6076) TaxID=234267 RepID=Q021P3_SOLUE